MSRAHTGSLELGGKGFSKLSSYTTSALRAFSSECGYEWSMPNWRQRIVSVLRGDIQTRARDANLDVAIIIRQCRLRVIAQRVLIPGHERDVGISVLNRLPSELAENLSAGRIRVFRQDVRIAGAGNIDLLELAIHRDRGRPDANRVHNDLVCQQHLQHIGIRRATAVFASVADNHDHTAAARFNLCKIESGFQRGVVQYAPVVRDDRNLRDAWV